MVVNGYLPAAAFLVSQDICAYGTFEWSLHALLVLLDSTDYRGSKSPWRTMANHFIVALNVVKCTYSTALLLFSIVIIMAAIAQRSTQVSQDVHSSLAFVLIWLAVIWLSMVEGGQAALVGLPPVDKELYKESHPETYKCTILAHKGDNLDRYLIGRQFLVVLIVFIINLSGRPLPDTTVLGLPDIVQKIFLDSGVAMILMTTNIGQLASQVNASHCMLDFINNCLALYTLYIALAIEFSGLLHSVYVVQMFFRFVSGKEFKSNEETRSDFQDMFFYGRVYMSLTILAFSFAVTLKALFDGNTTMWARVPPAASVVLFFLLMSIVGMLEGMQIAFYAVAKLSKDEQDKHPIAMKTCDLLFKGEGRNLPGFMIGRQICVTMCFFFIAKVTTINVDVEAGDDTIFGVSDGAQRFFNTGLLGALITTIIGSLSWQLVASTFPVAFLSNYLVYILLRFCLFLEATGVCSASWVLAWLQKRVSDFKIDEEYIGTPEERAARNQQDNEETLDVNPGHLFPGVPVMPRSVTRYKRKKQLSVRPGEALFPTGDDTGDTLQDSGRSDLVTVDDLVEP
jgi:silicon transporter